MTYKRRLKHKRRKLMKVVKAGLPALGLIIASGCEFESQTFSNPKSPAPYDLDVVDEGLTPSYDGNPKGSLYDAGFDLAGEASPDVGMAGESTAGETAAGEARAGETTAGETTAGETTAGESTAGETPAGESTAGESTAGESTAGETPAGETPAGETAAGTE